MGLEGCCHLQLILCEHLAGAGGWCKTFLCLTYAALEFLGLRVEKVIMWTLVAHLIAKKLALSVDDPAMSNLTT